MEKKFTLIFDKEPALAFIQEKRGGGFTLYQDGKPVRGIRSLTIRAAYDDATTHEIEYITGATKVNE